MKLLQVLRNRRYIPNAGKFCIHTAFIAEKGKTPWRRLTLVPTFLLIRWYSWLLSHYYLAPFPCYYVALFLYLLSFSDPYYYLVQFPLLLHCSNPICSFLDFSNLQFVYVGMDISEFERWILVKGQLLLYECLLFYMNCL